MTISWMAPLLLLPGVALLLVSTATRYATLHTESLHLAHDHDGERGVLPALATRLLARARRFRAAFESLYLSVTMLAMGGLLGAITELQGMLSAVIVIVCTCLGFASLIIAALQLMREAALSLEALEGHLKPFVEAATR